MEPFNARRITRIGVTAALYFLLTVSLSSLSYGPVQFRVAEMLMLLCFFNKDFIFSVSIGCFIANLFSSMSLDILFGTSATVISGILIYVFRKEGSIPRLLLCSLFPVAANAFIVGAELHYLEGFPFWLSAGEVALGEFVCITVLGVVVFGRLQKREGFMKLIRDKQEEA